MFRRPNPNTIVRCTSVAAAAASRRWGSTEEQAELDREAKLRQDLLKRQKLSSSSIFSRFMPPPGQNPFAAPGAGAASGNGRERPSFGQVVYTALLYSTALYLMIITFQMRGENTAAISLQGLPQLATPPEVTAAYLAVRVLLSHNTQRTLQQDFERYKAIHPTHNFYHFLVAEKSTALAGNRTTQAEFLAAITNALSSTRAMDWTRCLRQVSRWSDEKTAVDNAMDNLRRDYPAVCAVPPAPQPQPSYPYYQQQQQQQQWNGGYASYPTTHQQQAPPYNHYQQQPQQQQQHYPVHGTPIFASSSQQQQQGVDSSSSSRSDDSQTS